jgi:hypothetical protein
MGVAAADQDDVLHERKWVKHGGVALVVRGGH